MSKTKSRKQVEVEVEEKKETIVEKKTKRKQVNEDQDHAEGSATKKKKGGADKGSNASKQKAMDGEEEAKHKDPADHKKKKDGNSSNTPSNKKKEKPAKNSNKSQSASSSNKIHPVLVRGLFDVSVADLQDLFSECGQTRQVKIKGNGKAIVEFNDKAAAHTAMSLNGTEIDGKVLKVSKLPPEEATGAQDEKEDDGYSTSVCINSVPPGTTVQEVKEACLKHGGVVKVKMDKKRDGVAFCEFEEKDAARQAAKKSIRIGRTLCKTVQLKQESVKGPEVEKKETLTAKAKKNMQTTVLVKKLSEDVDTKILSEFFSKCGEAMEVRMASAHGEKIAFIKFGTKTAFRKALKMKGTELKGMKLLVSAAKNVTERSEAQEHQKRPKPASCRTIIVKNLPYAIGDTEEKIKNKIKRVFKVCGTVKDVRPFMERKQNGEDPTFKGMAYVEFNESEAADAALKMNGRDNDGRPMKIDWADNKEIALKKKFGTGKIPPKPSVGKKGKKQE